jgi:hypothetical protein
MSTVSSGGGRPSMYRVSSGARVPGVTTIIGKFKDPGGLIHWAWELGRDGLDYRDKRDDAGDAGAIAHGWIEDSIHGRPLRGTHGLEPSEAHEKAHATLGAFIKWRLAVNLTIVDTERPLVSELHQYGGTYDALAIVDGEPVLLDWKTGGRVYTEFVAQCAAYRQLIRENTKHQVTGAHLLRLGKELGDFHHHYYPPEALDLGWDRFLASKWLYETDAKLKKAIGA